MNNELHTGPLGEASQYAEGYSPERLFSMPRAEGRLAVGLAAHSLLWAGYLDRL